MLFGAMAISINRSADPDGIVKKGFGKRGGGSRISSIFDARPLRCPFRRPTGPLPGLGDGEAGASTSVAAPSGGARPIAAEAWRIMIGNVVPRREPQDCYTSAMNLGHTSVWRASANGPLVRWIVIGGLIGLILGIGASVWSSLSSDQQRKLAPESASVTHEF